MSLPVKKLLSDPGHLLAIGFGSGLLPKAPGTWGTLAAIPFYLFLSHFSLSSYILFCMLASVVGIWLCDRTAKYLGVHDHPSIVWDEMVGFWLIMIAVRPSFASIALAFVLFRFFDILKPWPIRLLDQKVSGGLGIMLDDILAAFYGWIILQLISGTLPQ